MKRKKIIGALLTGLAFLLCGCQISLPIGDFKAKENISVIRLATDMVEETPGYRQLVEFQKNVYEASEGKMEIKLYDSGSWGDDSLLEYVSLKVVEMAALSTNRLSQQVAAYEIYQLPYLFYDESQVADYALSSKGEAALGLLEQTEFKGIGFVGNGYYYFLQQKGRLGQNGSWSELLMQGPAESLYTAALNYLGITLVDENSGSVFNSYLLDEGETKALIRKQVVNEDYYLNDTDMFYQFSIALCSKEWWDDLPQEERDILTNGLKDSLKNSLQYEQNSTLADTFPEGGITFDDVSSEQKMNLYYATRNVFNGYLAANANPLANQWRNITGTE